MFSLRINSNSMRLSKSVEAPDNWCKEVDRNSFASLSLMSELFLDKRVEICERAGTEYKEEL